jgi:hypothetical protein
MALRVFLKHKAKDLPFSLIKQKRVGRLISGKPAKNRNTQPHRPSWNTTVGRAHTATLGTNASEAYIGLCQTNDSSRSTGSSDSEDEHWRGDEQDPRQRRPSRLNPHCRSSLPHTTRGSSSDFTTRESTEKTVGHAGTRSRLTRSCCNHDATLGDCKVQM